MRRTILVIISALATTGCAGTFPDVHGSNINPITRQRLAAAEASYSVGLDVLNAYRDNIRQCRKSEATAAFENRCRTRASTARLQIAVGKVDNAFILARKCVQGNPNSLACVGGIEDAVAAFRNTVSKETTGGVP